MAARSKRSKQARKQAAAKAAKAAKAVKKRETDTKVAPRPRAGAVSAGDVAESQERPVDVDGGAISPSRIAAAAEAGGGRTRLRMPDPGPSSGNTLGDSGGGSTDGHRGNAARAAATVDNRGASGPQPFAGSGTGAAPGCEESLPIDYVGLAATYVGAGVLGGPAVDRVRFVGRRVGTTTDAQDRFDRIEEVGSLPGRFTVTTRVTGITAGDWRVTATPYGRSGGAQAGRAQRLTVHTRAAPLLRGPSVRPFAWPLLVLLGVGAALASQAALVAMLTGRWGAVLAVSVLAVPVGFVAAKAWYLVLHRRSPRGFVTAGTCIQGFLVGGFGTLALGAWVTGNDVGVVLDATTPGVFFAMALARPGCLLGGCCAGRPTSSRWGVWSSDRRVAVRRVPVQLIEGGVALMIGGVALAIVVSVPPSVPGALFAAAAAGYTLGRQVLFPLRGEPRRTRFGRPLISVGAGVVLIATVASLVIAA